MTVFIQLKDEHAEQLGRAIAADDAYDHANVTDDGVLTKRSDLSFRIAASQIARHYGFQPPRGGDWRVLVSVGNMPCVLEFTETP